MSRAYQQLCALCRLASYGVDTISATTPEVKALKAAAKKELVNIARVIATAPKDKLREIFYTYYRSRAVFSRNEFGDYDDDDEARANEVAWLVTAIKRGLGDGFDGEQPARQVDDMTFWALWAVLGESWFEDDELGRTENSAG